MKTKKTTKPARDPLNTLGARRAEIKDWINAVEDLMVVAKEEGYEPIANHMACLITTMRRFAETL